MSENLAFTDRLIREMQDPLLRGGQLRRAANTEYLARHRRLAWDDCRGLPWVIPTSGPTQVAIWLMDAAAQFKPTGA